MRSEVSIPSGGEQLAAYLYRPQADGDVPCVVMAHGFSATRDDGLPAYAEAFQAAGFAVVLFDYRLGVVISSDATTAMVAPAGQASPYSVPFMLTNTLLARVEAKY